MARPDQKERMEALKTTVRLSDIVGETVRLSRAGRELKGCCPFHDDSTPSFYVNDELGVFYCFGCGVTGDVIDYVRKLEGCTFGDALDKVEFGYVPSRSYAVHKKPQHDTVAHAKKIWDSAVAIDGTPAETYLAKRALRRDNLPDLDFLRFARLSYDRSPELYPALIALITTRRGEFAGIQRTYLTEDGRKLDAHNAKRSLGQIKGNGIFIREGEWTDTSSIYLCEGLEDGLSISRMHNDHPVLVAAGAGMLASIELPGDCKNVTIAADNDVAGRAAAEAAARRFRLQGVEAFIHSPSWHFKDWNDYLQHFDGQNLEIFEDPDFRWARG